MPRTTEQSFNKFLVESIRLDPTDSDNGKASKKWLVSQIEKFPTDNKFPLLHPDLNIDYGSFSRKTKTRPLDDIDLMIILHAEGNYRNEFTDKIEIIVQDQCIRQRELCFDNTMILNSRKVINVFKNKLADIPQYAKADIKRNQEAVTLNLNSYDWVFDIVPCFITSPIEGVTFFLIPDGNGNWKKADPRIDKNRIIRLNQQRSVSVYDIVRLIKFWNKRPTMACASSYMLEVMILDYYETHLDSGSPRIELQRLFNYLSLQIHQPVYDPKGFQGDLNKLTWDERNSISSRAQTDNQKALEANSFEVASNHKSAIDKWVEIYGDLFPSYEL